jgi:hypothetical protein
MGCAMPAHISSPVRLGRRLARALCGCVRNGLERTYTEEKTVVQREVLEVVGQRRASGRRGRLSCGYSVGAALMMRGERRGRDRLAKIELGGVRVEVEVDDCSAGDNDGEVLRFAADNPVNLALSSAQLHTYSCITSSSRPARAAGWGHANPSRRGTECLNLGRSGGF